MISDQDYVAMECGPVSNMVSHYKLNCLMEKLSAVKIHDTGFV